MGSRGCRKHHPGAFESFTLRQATLGDGADTREVDSHLEVCWGGAGISGTHRKPGSSGLRTQQLSTLTQPCA